VNIASVHKLYRFLDTYMDALAAEVKA